MNVLVDSYGWIEYYSGGSRAKEYAVYIEKANRKEYYTPSIILYEVYKKIKSTAGKDKAVEAHAYITHYTTVVPFDERLAMDAADTSIEEGLGMADAIILAAARQHKAFLVTGDKHFKGKKDVKYLG